MIAYLHRHVIKTKVDRESVCFFRVVAVVIGVLALLEALFLLTFSIANIVSATLMMLSILLFIAAVVVKKEYILIYNRLITIFAYAMTFLSYVYLPLVSVLIHVFPVSVYLIFIDRNSVYIKYVAAVVFVITNFLLFFIPAIPYTVDVFNLDITIFFYSICFYGLLIRFFVYSNKEAKNYIVSQMSAIQDSIELVVKNTLEIERQQKGVLAVRQNVERSIRNERLSRGKLLASQEQLDQFAYAASHDLKEPIRTIRSFVQMSKRKLTPEQIQQLEVQEHFDLIENSAFNMHTVLEKLLSYSRVSKSKMNFSKINLIDVWNAVVKKEDLIDRVEMIIKEPSCQGCVEIFADAEQLQIVFSELLKNAVLFSKHDQSLKITLQIEKAEKKVDYIHVSISDNGIGIEAKYLEQVFGLFKRLLPRELYPGVGLGLPLARKIVKSMDGSLWLTSTLGIGTSAHLELPVNSKSV